MEALAELLAGTGLEDAITGNVVITVTRLISTTTGERAMGQQQAGPRRTGKLVQVAAVATIATLVPAMAVQAATGEPAKREGKAGWMEEVIVTAQRREQDVLDVPSTVTALSANRIEELGITGDLDLEQVVPGLQFAFDSEGTGVSMRGIGTQKAPQYNSDLAVAFYLDGIYTYAPETFGISPNLFDIERVEVARGPQGTLNGRNSIAGSISYISKKPTQEWDADVLTEFTDQFTQRYNVAFGGPIMEGISFRVSGGYYEGDGAQKNKGIGPDYDAPDQWNVAPSLRFEFDRIDITARFQRTEDQGSNRVPVHIIEVPRNLARLPPTNATNIFFQYDKPTPSVAKCHPDQFRVFGGICDDLKNQILTNRNSGNDNSSDRWSLQAEWEISETLALSYIYGGSTSDLFGTRDGDGTDRQRRDETTLGTPASLIPADCVARLGEAACATVRFSDSETGFVNQIEEDSHELLLRSNFGGAFEFLAGIYRYQNETIWAQSGANYASALNFTNAETAARALDLDGNGQPDFTSCQDFYTRRVLGTLARPASEFTGCEPGDNHLFKGRSGSGAESETKSVFFSGDYRFNEQWKVSAGVRYTEDSKRQIGLNGFTTIVNINGVPIRRTASLSNRDESWDAFIGSVSVEYTPGDNVMYYARVSTGYRAGGFNQISGGTSADDINRNIVPATFKEETLVNYELGIKGQFFDQHLTVTAAGYLQDFDDYHFNSTQVILDNFVGIAESPFLEYTANLQDTQIWGAEVEATWYVTDNFRLSGFYNYLGSEIGENSAFLYDRNACPFGQFVFACPPGVQFFQYTFINDDGQQETATFPRPRVNDGNQLPQQPEHKASLTAAYTWPMALGGQALGSVTLLATLSYTGPRFSNIANIDYQEIPNYERLDLRATWDSVDGKWSATVYVQNVLNEIGISEQVGFGEFSQTAWLTDPRQFGLVLRWRPEF